MYIDEIFMNEVGLGEMPEEEKQAFMEHATEELEARVGKVVGEGLSEEQMNEFMAISDNQEALGWLSSHVPNFREDVYRVFQGFKDELLAERASILGV